jgi:hypothetical protein
VLNHASLPIIHQIIDILQPEVGFFMDEYLLHDLECYYWFRGKPHKSELFYDIYDLSIHPFCAESSLIGSQFVAEIGPDALEKLKRSVYCYYQLPSGSMWLSTNEISDKYPYPGLFLNHLAQNPNKGGINYHITSQQHSDFVLNLISRFKK